MAQLSSNAALFLVLSGIPGTIAGAGWSEFAVRATPVGRADHARLAECRPPDCSACPTPGHRIRWPPELRGRSRPEHR